MRRILPWPAIVLVLAGTALVLRSQERLWWCSCDYLLLWSADPWSSDNSQHVLDPYSFTHVLHGFVLCGLLALIVPRLSPVWQLWLAISIEAFGKCSRTRSSSFDDTDKRPPRSATTA